MGLFNFLYKLTNIFSNKRKLKVFIILAIILFILFAWSRGVFASTPEDDLTLTNYQLLLQENFISYLRTLYQTKPSNFSQTDFNQLLSRLMLHQCYVAVPPSGAADRSIFWVYFYQPMNSGNNPNLFTTEGAFSTGLNSGTQIPCMLGDITCDWWAIIYGSGSQNNTPSYSTTQTSVLMPSACYLIRSTYINEFLNELGYYSTLQSTYSTRDVELQNITRSGFNNLNSSINSQTQTMTNSINSATNSITNSVDNLNNTITDTSTDDSQVEFAQDTNQDLTSGFFTNLYNSFESAFVDTAYKSVRFPIPFTRKAITFSSSYVLNNIKRNEKFSVLVTLAESFWWFALGYFVILDIYKKINAIKSGDLTNIENDNITTDLL